MIACSKSGRNNPHLSSPADSAAAWAGYPTSRTVGTPKRLVMPFAGFALTRAICPHAGTSPADDKDLSGSEGDLSLYAARGIHRMKGGAFHPSLSILVHARRSGQIPMTEISVMTPSVRIDDGVAFHHRIGSPARMMGTSPNLGTCPILFGPCRA